MHIVKRMGVGILLGFVAGILGMVTHAGPVDLPLIGLVLAAAIVGSGAWFALEFGRITSWTAYLVGVVSTTMWLSFFPPNGDSIYSVSGWASETWVVLAAGIPIVVCAVAQWKKSTRESPPEPARGDTADT